MKQHNGIDKNQDSIKITNAINHSDSKTVDEFLGKPWIMFTFIAKIIRIYNLLIERLLKNKIARNKKGK